MAASRAALVLQLLLFALILALLGADVALVKSHLACASYRRWEAATNWLGPGLLIGAGSVWLVRAAALLLARRFRPLLISLGILALEAGLVFLAIWLALDVTLFYCAFEGLTLPPCLFGCAH
jgi:hypothetical protein